MIEIQEPFPAARLVDAWAWLQQFPKANFDDSGPATCDLFLAEIERRLNAGERLFGFAQDGRMLGMAGFVRVDPYLGAFHGICFDRSVHGTGFARGSIAGLLAKLNAEGVRKVIATYFADNGRVHTFLKRLGAKQEGLLRSHSMRGGKLVDIRVAAFHFGEVQ